MPEDIRENPDEKIPLKSTQEVEEALKELESKELLYSIALFDVLGFSNFVQSNGNQAILDLYNKLLELIYGQESTLDGEVSRAGFCVPACASNDWKSNVMVYNANGFVRVCHFSDTFIIYVNYEIAKQPAWTRSFKYESHPLLLAEEGEKFYPAFVQQHPVYLSFLQTCMEFFCQAVAAGIPLRGCISTGAALMDRERSIYFGTPLVEAARGESAQNCMGIGFGKSFNNHHPVYHDYYIPYRDHLKDKERMTFVSPMALDWPRYWRNSEDYKHLSLTECIGKMNTDPDFSVYYDNAVKFAEFSAKHENWPDEIDWEGLRDIREFYERTHVWLEDLKNNNA